MNKKLQNKPLSKSDFDYIVNPIIECVDNCLTAVRAAEVKGLGDAAIFVEALCRVTESEIKGLEYIKEVTDKYSKALAKNMVMKFTHEEYMLGRDLIDVLSDFIKKRSYGTIKKACELALEIKGVK